jgi:hypothetical protein
MLNPPHSPHLPLAMGKNSEAQRPRRHAEGKILRDSLRPPHLCVWSFIRDDPFPSVVKNQFVLIREIRVKNLVASGRLCMKFSATLCGLRVSAFGLSSVMIRVHPWLKINSR